MCSGLLVGECDAIGVEVLCDDAGGGAGLFDLCDESEGIGTAVERGMEAPEIVTLQGRCAEVRPFCAEG